MSQRGGLAVKKWGGGFKAPPQKKNYVIKFQKNPRGRTAFLLDKFAGPLTPDFFTTKSSLYWVIWTSRHGYIFSAIFSIHPCWLKGALHYTVTFMNLTIQDILIWF